MVHSAQKFLSTIHIREDQKILHKWSLCRICRDCGANDGPSVIVESEILSYIGDIGGQMDRVAARCYAILVLWEMMAPPMTRRIPTS